MFDRIAPVYDAMNRVMTMGLDLRWRRLAALAAHPGDRVLDGACGTGDLAVADVRAGRGAWPESTSARMLEMRGAGAWIEWSRATCRAAVRERADAATRVRRPHRRRSRGCAASRRVLRPGGLAILEINATRCAGAVLRGMPDRVVPLLGLLLPGGSAYSYLPQSVTRFPKAEELAALLERTGFTDVRFRLLAGSIIALHTGRSV
jgi:demethylmenaquinone methyltransferase/2-methoxy-6-polyprenyl-1,4-benzoquinol methylase